MSGTVLARGGGAGAAPRADLAARAAIVAGAVWRFGVVLLDKWDQPLLLNDSLYYAAQAQQIAHGTWYREVIVDQPGAEHGPLTSLLLAPVSWMDDPVPWQRLVTAAFGVVTIVLLARLGRAIGGARVAAVAAWIAALSPNLWLNDGLVMSESLSMMLVSLTLLRARRLVVGAAAPEGSAWTRDAVVLGVVAALAALARSELALVALGLVVLVATSMPGAGRGARLRAAAVVAGAAAITVAPWVAFNLARFERPVLLTTNDGTTLLGAYCDPAFSGPGLGGWNLTCVIAEPGYRMDEEPSVRSARQRSIALAYARQHVDELPKVVAARLGRTLDLYGLDDLVAQDVGEERPRWGSWAGIVSWWLLAPCAVVGLRLLHARWRRLLLLPVLAVLVTTVVFYGGHRIRSSLEPVVVVAAAEALVHWWSRHVRRRPTRDEVFLPDGFGAAPVVEQRAREGEHHDEHAGAVQVLEAPGPRGVHDEARRQLAAEHDDGEGAGERDR